MALSRVTIPGDGVTDTFTVSFALGYINEADVTARVGDEADGLGDPVYRNITFLSPELLQIDGTPAGVGVPVVFERTVVDDSLLVDYVNGDIINDTNLNTAQKQALMLVHQVLDGRFSAIDDDIDLGQHRITNSAEPVNPTDLVTKQYVDATIPGLVSDTAAYAAAALASANTATVQAGIATVQATNSVNAAAASDLFKDRAHDWAQEDEDVPINDGEHPEGFSAYHYAQKAAATDIGVIEARVDALEVDKLDVGAKAADSELLDGNDSAFFRDASNLNAGLVPNPQFPIRLRKEAVSDVNDNANLLVDNGWYHITPTGINGPTAGTWYLIYVQAFNSGSQHIRQEAWALSSAESSTDSRTWIRDYHPVGFWTPWRKVYKTAAELNSKYSQWYIQAGDPGAVGAGALWVVP